MDKSHIAVIVAVVFALAFRLYKKYGQKGGAGTGTGPKNTSFPSSSGEDDYEPYSKK